MAPRGCSNVGKYEGLSPDDFCGPAGGSCQGTYPVNTPKRAIAALSYARHAPYPEGIKRCAKAKAKKEGWMDASGKIRRDGKVRKPGEIVERRYKTRSGRKSRYYEVQPDGSYKPVRK